MMFEEPEIQPDDTRPTMTVPAVTTHSMGQRIVGFVSLLGALGFTLATVGVLVTPPSVPPTPINEPVVLLNTDIPTNTHIPATDMPTLVITQVQDVQELPTLSHEERQNLLLTPVNPVMMAEDGQVIRNPLNPFTIIPERARNEVIKYTVQKGDTMYDIALRFGVSQESLAWSNDRRVIWTLQPGMELNIPPVDGVYYRTVGTKTLATLAQEFKISDPFLVVDSPYNPHLYGFDPSTAPPSGTWVFFPGGEAEGIDWTPPSIVSSRRSGGGSGSVNGDLVGFQLSDPGSCGLLEPGGGTAWGSPMAGGTYTVTRGFSSWHTGIDLASSTGTSVYAANGGRVIFAGWNNWGYGRTIVISHGSINTLYGHLNSVNVSCGQVVSMGQIIGTVGSTGNSSGPHLHFEIMYGSSRSDPAATLAF
jgi:murein DD-endopeptidase MepM/ murein hydrolase activator NlpD